MIGPISDADKERLRALRTLALRGVGGERENARRLLARRLDSLGIEESAFENACRREPAPAVDDGPREESLPADLRTVYVAGAVRLTIRHGEYPAMLRGRTAGATLRAGTLLIEGEGDVTVTLPAAFRTLYASEASHVVVDGFRFSDVALHHSGTGSITPRGAAVRAAFRLDGEAVVDASDFQVTSCRVTLAGASRAKLRTRDLSATVRRHARLTAEISGRSEIQNEPGSTVKISRRNALKS